jgi:hypothetical protein
MTKNRFALIALSVILLTALVGCGSIAPQATATPVPTETPVPLPTVTSTPVPTQTPLPVPTKVSLPDISGVVKEYGLVPYTGDFTCVAPDCEEYTDQSTGLLMQMFSDGSGFKITLGWPINNKLGLFKKVLTELYPDLATDIINAIPATGNSGDVVLAFGSDQNYNWDVSGVWYMAIFVHIAPK